VRTVSSGAGRVCPVFLLPHRGWFGDNPGVNLVDQGQVEHLGQSRPTYRLAVFGPVGATLAAFAAAWFAAGSVGLLAHPLRRAMTLIALAFALLTPLGEVARPWIRIVLTPLIACAAAAMVIQEAPIASIMAATLVLVFLALISRDQSRDILVVAAASVTAFGVYTFARTSIPWFWLAADAFGHGVSALGSALTHRPLRTGETFAGLDFLFVTVVFWVGCLACTRPPRAARVIYGFLAILGGQLLYLAALAFIPDLLASVPEPAQVETHNFASAIHKALPWNAPILLGVIDSVIIAAMLRWSIWIAPFERQASSGRSRYVLGRIAGIVVALALAAALPVVAVLQTRHASLTDKKIVFYEKGFLNWLKPTHGSYGQYSSGMYGMLPVFLQSLGAQTVISPDLSEEDLQDADVLVLLFPDDPWVDGQLDRIQHFVRAGGSLLLMGDHTEADPNGGNRFNEVLAPTNMRIRFDSAIFAVGGWLDSYETLHHPTTIGIRQDRNQFGVVVGASVEARWPARPLLVGRWGWADAGDPANTAAAMLGNYRYNPGEQLGDTVLAAEQPLGKGRVVAFGDTSSLQNGINVGSHVFTSRLFAYLADTTEAQPPSRQLLALWMAAMLIVLVCHRPGCWKSVLVALALTVSLTVCLSRTAKANEVLPDGRGQSPNNLAYIDASHLEAYSGESWRPDGIGGLALTLMRNGYLALSLPEMSDARIERAGLVISIAPSRAFSLGERQAVEKFVKAGGIFILTVGYERSSGSQTLLKQFGFAFGSDDQREPEPMGHFKAPYEESAERRVYVRFHAAWPIRCDNPSFAPEMTNMVYGPQDRPVIIARRVGKGQVVLIADTCFAMNMNLENQSGEPFEGLRENADFWRWWSSLLRGGPLWLPPRLQTEGQPSVTVPPENISNGETPP
jgi:hypothetical protein